jgi:hypothetical protein
MAPLHGSRSVRRISGKDDLNESGREAMGLEYIILESWSQGVLVGGIVILVLITLANIRRGVLLHKLILLEVYAFPVDGQELQITIYQLVLNLGHGTFIFFPDPIFGWQVTPT